MQRAVQIIFLFLCCAFVAVHGGCNSTCANNNQCNGIQCSRCNITIGSTMGTCVAGYGCGQKCQVSSDCNLFSGCDLCTDGVCSTNSKGCGVACANSIITLSPSLQCRKWTLLTADIDNGCSDPYCTACIGGYCTTGYGCGHSCMGDADCSTTSNCTACIQGVCATPCGRTCSVSSNCEAACGNCLDNICSSTPITTGTATTTSTSSLDPAGGEKRGCGKSIRIPIQ